MKVISLSKQFIKTRQELIKTKNINSRLNIYHRLYFNPNRNIIKPYLNWGDYRDIKNFLNNVENISPEQITKNEKNLIKQIPQINKRVKQYLKLKTYYTKLIAMVGFNYNNGCCDYYQGRYVPIILLENRRNKNYQDLKIFLTHEILHAINFNNNPQSFYWDKNKKRNLLNYFYSEGLATYLTSKILKISLMRAFEGALESDNFILKERKWLNKNIPLLKMEFRKYLNKEAQIGINKFFGGTPPNSIPYNRTGYYLGALFIKQLSKKLNYKQLIRLDKLEIEKQISLFLKD